MGDRMDNIHPGAMPWLHRYVGNPVLTRHPQPLLPHRRRRRPLRHARAAPRRAAAPRPAHDRHGVRLRDGHPRVQGEAARSREFPIEYHPRGGESKLSSFRDGWRHLRFLLVHSPDAPVHPARARSWRALGALIALTGARADRHLRPLVGPAHDDRRRAADDRRHAGRRARPRAPTPTARTSWASATRGSTACARASGSSTACCSAAALALGGLRPRRGHRRSSGSPRGFAALSEQRLAVAAATLLIVGIQIFFSSFLLSILGLRREDR